MPIPFKRFELNPDANFLHTTGVEAATTGDFDNALLLFDAAIKILPDTHPNGLMQTMRIQRDFGFTLVRKGVVETDLSMIEQGRKVIVGSRIGHTAAISEITADTYSVAARRYLNAEIGASRNATARAIDAQYVMERPVEQSEAAEELTAWAAEEYISASDACANGDNRYYEASNAMTYARHLRMIDERGVVGWVRTAAASAREAKRTSDHKTARAARNTVLSRMRDLRTAQAAQASVLIRP